MSQSINLLLLYPEEENQIPVPVGDTIWVDNLGDIMVTNTGAILIFNPGT